MCVPPHILSEPVMRGGNQCPAATFESFGLGLGMPDHGRHYALPPRTAFAEYRRENETFFCSPAGVNLRTPFLVAGGDWVTRNSLRGHFLETERGTLISPNYVSPSSISPTPRPALR